MRYMKEKYVSVDYCTLSEMLKHFKLRWIKRNARLVNSGFIMEEETNKHRGSSNYIFLKINNQKKAMLTRIRFGI
jgi:hypothetical protein